MIRHSFHANNTQNLKENNDYLLIKFLKKFEILRQFYVIYERNVSASKKIGV